jgi:phospholipid transport system substrate-binding protein
MKPHFLLPFFALLALAGAAQAQPPQYGYGGPSPYGMTPRTSPVEEASAFVREGMTKLLEFLGQDEQPNKLQVAAFLDKEIAPYFDFAYMARWVAGPAYVRMNPDQRKALAAKLEARFLSALAKQLATYEGQQVRFFRPRMSSRGSVSVNVGILRPGAYPAKLKFRLYRSKDGWKVYDVAANGRSVSAYYRLQLQRGASMPTNPLPYRR